jgi:hypothetical protein
MDVELHESLTRGFGPEPPHRPVTDRLAAGQRAVRRRRLAGAAVTVAVASVVGLGATMVANGNGGGNDQVATDPTSTTEPAVEPWQEGEVARYSDDGMVEVRPGVKVLHRINDPLGDPSDFNHSVALALEFRGSETWLILSWETDPNGGTSETAAGGPVDGTFADWVEQAVAANEDNSGGYVEFADDGSLVASHGVTILDQRHPVPLKDFVLAGEPSAAALLQGPDGKKWYVVVRDSGGLDVIATPFRTGGPDLDAFLDYAREKYASGEGLR